MWFSGVVDPVLTRWAALGLLLLAAVAFGLWRRRTDGRTRTEPGVAMLGADELAAPLGERATLVQFSTDFCRPCRAARRVLDAAARSTPGVAHVEVDAAARTDLVRRFDVRRTPTLLVLDAAGRVVRRASGVPAVAEVRSALAAVGGGSG